MHQRRRKATPDDAHLPLQAFAWLAYSTSAWLIGSGTDFIAAPSSQHSVMSTFSLELMTPPSSSLRSGNLCYKPRPPLYSGQSLPATHVPCHQLPDVQYSRLHSVPSSGCCPNPCVPLVSQEAPFRSIRSRPSLALSCPCSGSMPYCSTNHSRTLPIFNFFLHLSNYTNSGYTHINQVQKKIESRLFARVETRHCLQAQAPKPPSCS